MSSVRQSSATMVTDCGRRARSRYGCTTASPQTLLHNDPHRGNWYITGAGRMGLLDWQTNCFGHWSRDLAYALPTLLTVDQRRAWEYDLLCRYRLRAELDETVDEAWLRYRQQLAGGLLFWAPTLRPSRGFPDMQPRTLAVELLTRITTAMVDHDTVDLLEREAQRVRAVTCPIGVESHTPAREHHGHRHRLFERKLLQFCAVHAMDTSAEWAITDGNEPTTNGHRASRNVLVRCGACSSRRERARYPNSTIVSVPTDETVSQIVNALASAGIARRVSMK